MIRHASEYPMSFLPEDDISLYMKEVRKIPVLDLEEEAYLLERAQAGDRQAMNTLVDHNLRFVVSICMRYRNRGVPLGDLINEGNLGLIRAVERFRPGHGVKFISYAIWWIRQVILLALPRQSGPITLSPSWSLDRSRIRRAENRLLQRYGRPPTPEEVAAETGMTLAVAREHTAGSLPGSRPPDCGSAEKVEEIPGGSPDLAPDAETRQALIRKYTDAAMATLGEREAEVIRGFYGLDSGEPATLEEIGGRLGLSRERIRQIKDMALAKLRLPSPLANLRAARAWTARETALTGS
jgi:RNA polymerase primary sigma factor